MRLLLETDLLDDAGSGAHARTTDDGDTVEFSADLEKDAYHIRVNRRRVRVPTEQETEALMAYADEDFDKLRDLYQTIFSQQVRIGLMDRFMPRFEEARIDERLKKTDEGWLIDETFTVQWNGENYLNNNVQTHLVRGGKTVEADEPRQARKFVFDVPEEATVTDPAGHDVTLSEREIRFLATVECLLNPDEYLSEDDAQFVEDAKEAVSDPIASVARSGRVAGWTDEKSGIYHDHEFRKHTLSMLDVTDEAAERLFYNDHDHAGVHELKVRRAEFENAPFSVFNDAPNDDAGKWAKIENTSERAPISPATRHDINSRFE